MGTQNVSNVNASVQNTASVKTKNVSNDVNSNSSDSSFKKVLDSKKVNIKSADNKITAKNDDSNVADNKVTKGDDKNSADNNKPVKKNDDSAAANAKKVDDLKNSNLNNISDSKKAKSNSINDAKKSSARSSKSNIKEALEEIEEKITKAEDLNSLIALISSLVSLGSNNNQKDDLKQMLQNQGDNNSLGSLNEMLKNILSQNQNSIGANLTNILKDEKAAQQFADLINSIKTMFDDKNVNSLIDNDNMQSLKEVFAKISSVLNDSGVKASDNKQIKNIQNIISELRDKIDNIKANSDISNKVVQSTQKSDLNVNLSYASGKESSNDSDALNSDSKEDKLLKSLINDNKKEAFDDKFAFIANRINAQVVNTESVEKVNVINKGTMQSDLIKNVKFMVTEGVKEMTVKLNPAQLGHLTIKIVEHEGVMKAEIKAASKETYALLSQQAGEIKSQLNETNIKIEEVNINLYEEDASYFKGEEFADNTSDDDRGNTKKFSSGLNISDEDVEEDDEVLDNYNNINMLA